jgi:hypothetical protein
MHWKTKALIQNLIARLPDPPRQSVYHALQRRFGGAELFDPVPQFRAGIEMARRMVAAGGDPTGATVVEVGTGRRIATPLALWLAGAQRTLTVDLNPYLREDLVRADLAHLAARSEAIVAWFREAGLEAVPQRLARFEELARAELHDILEATGITYHSPGDARALPLGDGEADLHVSFNVLEHIEPAILGPILAEGGRVTRGRGWLLHRVDYTDHFAHSDPSITMVNFLQYPEGRWRRYAGNPFMYMNRLRVDDMEALFREQGLAVLDVDAREDEAGRAAIEAGMALAVPFADKPAAVNATADSWILARAAENE